MWDNSDLSCTNSIVSKITSNPTEISSSLTGILLLLQSLSVNGFLVPLPSSVSMNSVSFAWYMALTPFETVFLSMIIIQIFVLRWLDILPLNINNILHGDPSGRKKRDVLTTNYSCNSQDSILTESVFNLVKKLDRQECFLLTICQLQSQLTSTKQFIFPEEIKRTLNGIQMFSKWNKQSSCTGSNSTASYGIEPFEEAVIIGSRPKYNNTGEKSSNLTCHEKYSTCPLNEDDIIHYMNIILN